MTEEQGIPNVIVGNERIVTWEEKDSNKPKEFIRLSLNGESKNHGSNEMIHKKLLEEETGVYGSSPTESGLPQTAKQETSKI